MSLPLRLHRDGCRCKKCLPAIFTREAIEQKILILAQLGRTGTITARELTGEQEKVKGAVA
jgi:hypothetical protein